MSIYQDLSLLSSNKILNNLSSKIQKYLDIELETRWLWFMEHSNQCEQLDKLVVTVTYFKPVQVKTTKDILIKALLNYLLHVNRSST